MAASCRKAAQARLWSNFFKDPSLWKDNRNTKTNPRAPDFTHKLTNEPLWLDSWLNPSWVHDRLKGQKTAEPLRTTVHWEAPEILCGMLSSLQDARQSCSDLLSTHVHAVHMHGDVLSSSGDALQMQGDLLHSHADGMHICDDTFSYVASPPFMGQGLHDLANRLLESRKGIDLDPPSDPGKLPHDDLADLLHKCKKERDLDCALCLHHYMHDSGLDADTSLGNSLVLMLVDAGSLCNARQVFDKLQCRYESSWNALITGYAKCGESQNALDLYQKMQDGTSLHPTATTFVALLKACTMLKDLEMGEHIEAHLDKGLVEADVFVGSTLINMYGKCGRLAKAQEVFNNLQVQNVVSWNAIIAGYVEHGHSEEALNCYKQMDCIGISPDGVTLVCSLKACGDKGDVRKGREIHAELVRKGFLESDVFIGSTLVDMYADCGSLAEAQEVFNKLPVRNVVSWNALIAGYTEHGYGEKALDWFEQMQHGVISPDAITLICSLKACASKAAGVKAQQIHAEIARKGLLDSDIFLGSILVDAYAKCGWPADAQSVFRFFSVKDVVLWNALISGLTELGQGEEALKYFDQMRLEGVSPNAGTLICSLKACSSIGASLKGRDIHMEIVKSGWLEQDAFVGSILVDLYSKCGLCTEAQNVFQRLPARDVVSWNALLAGYADDKLGEEVLKCFRLMQLEGFAPDSITFVCSLKACSSIGAIITGREIHIEVVKKGLLENEVGNALIDMYAKCCSLADAQNVFDHLPALSVVSLNTLISGYVECGYGEKAVIFYDRRQQEHIVADAVMLVCSLKACGAIKAIAEGQEIHDEILCKGLEQDLAVGNTLVDYYAKCGYFAEAQETFHKLQTRDTVAWTALITGYVEHGCGEEALYYFEKMLNEGVSSDAVTLVCSLTACGNTRATVKGGALHAEATRKGLLDTELSVGSTLVDMYAKCGSLGDAQKVFHNLPFRDIVSWNALIAGYVELGCGEGALSVFEQMRLEGISSDASTLVYGLKACGSMGATDKGQEVHSEIVKKGLDRELLMGNTLVDMYVKCGVLAAAQEAFDKLPVRDLVSWNTLIAGYGQRGQSENVFLRFEKMREEGISPDLVTLSSVLNACSHAGEVDMGQMYFEAISCDYLVMPTLEHYTCIVDLLGRAGQVEKAMAVINKMPLHPGIVAWHSALGACQRWGNVEIGTHAFESVMGLDENDAAAYVCMCNIYSNAAVHEQEMSMDMERRLMG